MRNLTQKLAFLLSSLLLLTTTTYAQDQLAIWSFDNLSGVGNGTFLNATDDDVPGTPYVRMFDANIDSDGRPGVAYTDKTGTNRSAGDAIEWNDPKVYSSEADLYIYFSTKRFKNLRLRFDYRTDNGGSSSFDLDYRIGTSGSNFNEIKNNEPLTNDGNWHSMDIDLSQLSVLSDREGITLRLNDFTRFTGNNRPLAFDNIEIYGDKFEYDQLAIWTFDQLSGVQSGTPLAPTAEQTVGTPPLFQLFADIDADGRPGIAYTDLNGVNHGAGSAIEWDDPQVGLFSAANLGISISTKGYENIYIRFDYRVQSGGADGFDLFYTATPLDLGSYTRVRNNSSLQNDGSWHTKEIDLSTISALDNRNSMYFAINDFFANGGNNRTIAFDNIEIYGIKTPCLLDLVSAPSIDPICDGESGDLDVSGISTSNALGDVTFSYKEVAGSTGSASLSHSDNTVADASVMGTGAGDVNYRLVVEDEVGCKDSVDFTITVKPLPVALAPTCNNCGQIRVTICQEDDAPDLQAFVEGNANYVDGATLNWYDDDDNSIGSPLGSAPVVDNQTQGNTFYWVSQTVDGCEGPATQVRIRVKRLFTPDFNLPALGCGTNILNLALYVSDPANKATAYTFYSEDPRVNPAATPVGSVSATKGVVNFGQIVNVTINAANNTYYVQSTVPNGCGGVAVSTTTANSNVAILDPISNQTYNHGDPVNISFTAPNSTNIVWYNLPPNPNIGIVGIAGNTSLIFTATNNTASAVTATIRVIAYVGGCATDIKDFDITVNPGPPIRSAQSNYLSLLASKINDHDVKLSWDINYDYELSHYEVEKLKGEDQWETIGRVEIGDALEFVDRGGMTNVTKYRLKLVHPDGRLVWSNEVEVSFDFFENNRFKVYPNPTAGRATLRAIFPISQAYNWQLNDMMGKTLMRGQIEGEEASLNLSNLPAGVYHLVTVSEDGKRYLNRIVKQ